ncbi:RNA polymerase sigma factor [Dasania marina]|uniref:RNA polymerase sigma factor n=1 Tax=Dasania marina TaxID=471499 RepID=UPI00037C3172|nr:RNA polymerase sigma factor [Dasania marina]
MSFLSSPSQQPAHSQFEQLVHPHIQHLYHLAHRLHGNQSDAEDLVQDLLIKLYPRLEEMLSIEKLRPWLARIMYRLFIDHWRKKKQQPEHYPHDDGEQILAQTPEPTLEPDQLIDQTRLSHNLNAAIKRLSVEQRVLITLHLIEGYSLNDLAMVLELPLGTVKSRLHRTKDQLKKSLRKTEPLSTLTRVNS